MMRPEIGHLRKRKLGRIGMRSPISRWMWVAVWSKYFRSRNPMRSGILAGNSGLPPQRVIAPPLRSAVTSALYSDSVMFFNR